MIGSVLVANRGEIARRVVRTARRLGIRSVAVYSEVDADLPFVAEADEAVPLGPASPALSYRNAEAILAAAKATGAEAVHPGYGFLSENADFARAVADHGLTWVGPGAEAIAAMGDKINARNLMAAAGVPVAPGTADPVGTVDAALAQAERIGYPLMVKAAAGGGGMGMAVATDPEALAGEFGKVRAFAERVFGDGAVLLERYFPRVRHVEVQILGLADGRVVALGERECSVQRRNQKLLEETPSPAVSPALRQRLQQAAVRAGEAVGYRNAGTVECLLDPATGEFFFLEMNTRLQVEHPITETVHGLDLVEEQFRIASGLPPTFGDRVPVPHGHAIELRVNAEDPKRFLPGPGAITTWVEPAGEGVRVDAGYTAGNTVTMHYDSLMAKLVVSGPDRATAIERARAAVAGFEIAGPKCNLPFFAELLDNPEFRSGDYDTGLVGRMR
ncbi:MAG TPA: biotin carboxylase N-terminal domain-containing protein [Rugosimonospora sp.]|nr:biotin carboxylase N-terminal domain-containing protein [Rugosimonospora sp.]